LEKNEKILIKSRYLLLSCALGTTLTFHEKVLILFTSEFNKAVLYYSIVEPNTAQSKLSTIIRK